MSEDKFVAFTNRLNLMGWRGLNDAQHTKIRGLFNEIDAKDATVARLEAENASLREEVERLGSMIDDASKLLEVTDDHPVNIAMRKGKPITVVMTGDHYTNMEQTIKDATSTMIALRTRAEQAEKELAECRGKVEKVREFRERWRDCPDNELAGRDCASWELIKQILK